jgi:hypothetical protein
VYSRTSFQSMGFYFLPDEWPILRGTSQLFLNKIHQLLIFLFVFSQRQVLAEASIMLPSLVPSQTLLV